MYVTWELLFAYDAMLFMAGGFVVSFITLVIALIVMYINKK